MVFDKAGYSSESKNIMGVPITAQGYQKVPGEEVCVSRLQIKVVTREIVLIFALVRGWGRFFCEGAEPGG